MSYSINIPSWKAQHVFVRGSSVPSAYKRDCDSGEKVSAMVTRIRQGRTHPERHGSHNTWMPREGGETQGSSTCKAAQTASLAAEHPSRSFPRKGHPLSGC